MTTIIQQQNNFLHSIKQLIVQNLNDMDCIRDMAIGSAEDMDTATVTLREILYQYKHDDWGQLFDDIEKTKKVGTYRFLFHERNTETVDNMFSNLDAISDAFWSWDNCDVRFRYMTALPISVVGRVSKSTPSSFWSNHLAAFKSNGIPAETDTQALQYSTKKCAPWVRTSQLYSSRMQFS
jgi:hypothetical protein